MMYLKSLLTTILCKVPVATTGEGELRILLVVELAKFEYKLACKERPIPVVAMYETKGTFVVLM
jgi:hypothetical protein